MAHSIHLEHYLDSLESLPAELRRNLTLLRDLDERAEGLSGSLVREADRYSAEVAGLEASGRRHQLAAIDQLHTKLRELADDKVQLAIQTYELVDKHIRRLDSDLALFESEIKQKGLGARGRSTDESGKKAARKKSDGRRRRKSSSDEGSPPPQKRGRKSASGAAAAGEEGAAPTELSPGHHAPRRHVTAAARRLADRRAARRLVVAMAGVGKHVRILEPPLNPHRALPGLYSEQVGPTAAVTGEAGRPPPSTGTQAGQARARRTERCADGAY
ncbi:Inhibitor of growth protein 4 [Amphibalanus amphitrite]|uniref:Inhibitor of growth protein 4 n=1 Tax=Amphibalanus amphitrite TaxID=1232801 RepID=A0A6A4V9U6_AMPAM|nr:Inhibitor of growth protein 4 [Amphibalanus amphitrite]